LDPKSDIEEINNTAYLICEVLGKYNTMHCSHEILQNLLERTTIDYFFELLKTKDSVTCCAVALILGNIFAYYILINTPKVIFLKDESFYSFKNRFKVAKMAMMKLKMNLNNLN